MAATATLLKASFFFVHRDSRPPVTLLPLKWRNPILLRTAQNPPLLPSIKKTTTTGGGFSVQCVMNNNSKNCFMEEEDGEEEEEEEKERKRNQNQNPLNRRFAEVMMLSGILFLAYDPNAAAIAASGGRMGGQSFSSSSRSSSSRSSSSSSSSRSSPSYSSSCYYSDDNDDFFSSPPPFSCSISSPTYYLYSIGEVVSEWFFFMSIISGIAIILISVFQAFRPPTTVNSSSEEGSSTLTNPQTTTVLKLQVGLMGMKRSLQKALDRIAETADTSTIKGLSDILRDTTSLLLKHPGCCISGYSSVDVKQSIEDGEKLFNRICIEERGKFDEETLVNVDNNKRQNARSKGANGVNNEYMVITILVAAKGVHKLPTINGSADLKEALQKLGSISSNKTMAALEVLWTPQEKNDTLTEQELHEDYPLLRPLYKDQDTQPLEKC